MCTAIVGVLTASGYRRAISLRTTDVASPSVQNLHRCWASDGRSGRPLRVANPNDELDRPFDLEREADLLPPRVFLEGVRHRVMSHPQFGRPEKRTHVERSRVEQRLHAVIGAGDHQETGAPAELSPRGLDR